MNIAKKLLLNLWFGYIALYCCFGHLFANDTPLYIVLIVLFGIIVVRLVLARGKIYKNLNWIVPGGMAVLSMAVSILYSVSQADSIKVTILYSIFFLFGVAFYHITNWQDIYYRWMIVGCGFHLAFTIFSVFFTNVSLRIAEKFLTTEVYQQTARWADMKLYSGLSGQTGNNAFYFTVLIGIFISKLLSTKKNRKMNFVILILSGIGLGLTGKKSHLLSVCIAIAIILVMLYIRKKGKRNVLLCIAITSITLVLCMILFQEKLWDIFRVSVLSRLPIYEAMFQAIEERPVLGAGASTVGMFTPGARQGHNIYLQILTEQGILGLILLMIALIAPIVWGYRVIKYRFNNISNKAKSSILYAVFFAIFVIFYGMTGNPIYDYNIVISFVFAVTAGMEYKHIQRYSCNKVAQMEKKYGTLS